MAEPRRIRQHLGKHLPPVRLHLDDVEAIYEILKEGSDQVAIKTARFELDDPNLLPSVGTSFQELEIRSRNPYVSVNLKDNNIWLYASEDDPLSQGLFNKIEQILRQRRRKVVRWIADLPLAGLVGGIPGGLAVGLLINWIQKHEIGLLVGGLLAASLTAAYWFISFHYFKAANVVMAIVRESDPGFFRRNRDALILGTALAIVGALAGSLATYFLTNQR